MAEAFGLLQRLGIEIEYMVCDATSLDIRPQAHNLLRAFGGSSESDFDVLRPKTIWCRELAAHVVEFKTRRPVPNLRGLATAWQQDLKEAGDRLQRRGLLLLPTAMHPWMHPERETRLWPFSGAEIYQIFDSIFNCRGHGWSNLQSVHLNLSFSGDVEFAKLHAAIRIILPLLPALAASSPFVAGARGPYLDSRLYYYDRNCRRRPVVTGLLVPEAIQSESEYRHRIFRPIAAALARWDQNGLLDPEWTNARGAIARFSRNSIEIRVLDSQECLSADLAIAEIVTAAVRHIIELGSRRLAQANRLPTAALRRQLLSCSRYGEGSTLALSELRSLLELNSRRSYTTQAAWLNLSERLPLSGRAQAWLRHYQAHGCLARRLVKAWQLRPTRRHLRRLYAQLADGLQRDAFYPCQDLTPL